ncbi:MAG: phage terminase large subunit [Magnetococcus sp. MYC-9]
MAHSHAERIAVRTAYVAGASLVVAAMQVGVPEATARAWKRAAVGADDWDRLRDAWILSSSHNGELVQNILREFLVLHHEAIQKIRTLPAEEQVNKMASLAYSLNKYISELGRAAPELSRLGVIISRIFVLWRVATGRSHCIAIIMDAYEQAAAMLESVKAELEANQRLMMDFPQRVGLGATWKEGVIVTRGNIKIQAFGSGKRMRGLFHGPYRPDLVICDDLENDENVRSRTQRDKLEKWLRMTVLRLGPPDDSMQVVVIGTVLHHDSLLSRLLRDPMWESQRFAAIIRWPDRMDLWERWEQLLRIDGEVVADGFFQVHRQEMEAGAVVSWPGVRPLLTLMKIRARDGVDSFDSELQNAPLSENALFATLHFWNEPNPEWIFFGAVDPSMGKSGRRGDPSAILVGGVDRVSGRLSVVEADIARRTPERIIERVIGLQKEYGCIAWAVETVQFQEFFKDELVRQSACVGIPVPARGIKPRTDKALRIESLQPHIINGLILFHPRQTALLEQLRHFGEPDSHDDGPDALHMLYALAVTGRASVDSGISIDPAPDTYRSHARADTWRERLVSPIRRLLP